MKLIANITHQINNSNHKYDVTIPVFMVDGCSVSLNGNCDNIVVIVEKNIATVGAEEMLLSIFYTVYKLLFLAIGVYPRLNSLDVDEISKMPKIYKYSSAETFRRDYLQFADIDATLINESKINKLKSLNQKPICSFEYLVSEEYSSIMTVHKLALFLQTAEGIYHSITKEDSSYKDALEAVFNKFLDYNAESNFKAEILTRLGKTNDEFFLVLKDTRDDVTHYFEEVDNHRKNRHKTNSLDRTPDWNTRYMWEYMFCTYYAIRIYLADYLGFTLNENNIKESLYTLHDLIYRNNCERANVKIDISQYKSLSAIKQYGLNQLSIELQDISKRSQAHSSTTK